MNNQSISWLCCNVVHEPTTPHPSSWTRCAPIQTLILLHWRSTFCCSYSPHVAQIQNRNQSPEPWITLSSQVLTDLCAKWYLLSRRSSTQNTLPTQSLCLPCLTSRRTLAWNSIHAHASSALRWQLTRTNPTMQVHGETEEIMNAVSMQLLETYTRIHLPLDVRIIVM
jgi:hypothetical protein